VDHQAAIGKVKTVTLDFPGCLRDFLLFLISKIRQIINELPGIGGVGDHKAKLKTKLSDAATSEIVSLDHLHVVDRFGTYAEIHSKTHGF